MRIRQGSEKAVLYNVMSSCLLLMHIWLKGNGYPLYDDITREMREARGKM